MDWFKRYGLPGVYFLALIALWVYVFGGLPLPTGTQGRDIAAMLVVLSIPVGYLISLLGMFEYEFFGGSHRRALNLE